MSNVTFLMDANAFITPYQQYYPFDLAPIFWANLKDRIEKGSFAWFEFQYQIKLVVYE